MNFRIVKTLICFLALAGLSANAAKADGPYSSGQTVTRTFDNLQEHSTLTAYFEIELHDSWDGSNRVNGPDTLTIQVKNGPTLLNAHLKARKGRYYIRRPFTHSASSVTFLMTGNTTDAREKWTLHKLDLSSKMGSAWITNSFIETSYKNSNGKRVRVSTAPVQKKQVHTAVTWWVAGKKWIHGPHTFKVHRSDSSWAKTYNWRAPKRQGDGSLGNDEVSNSSVYDLGNDRTSFPVTHTVRAQGTPSANWAEMSITYHTPFETEKETVTKRNYYRSGNATSHDIPKGGVGNTTDGPFNVTRQHSGYTLNSPYGNLKALWVSAGIVGTITGAVTGGATTGAAISIAAAIGSHVTDNRDVPAEAKFQFNNNMTLFQRSINADAKLRKVNFVQPEKPAILARANPELGWAKARLMNVNYRQYYITGKFTGKFYNRHGFAKSGSVTEELPFNKPVAMGYYVIGATGVASTPTSIRLAELASP